MGKSLEGETRSNQMFESQKDPFSSPVVDSRDLGGIVLSVATDETVPAAVLDQVPPFGEASGVENMPANTVKIIKTPWVLIRRWRERQWGANKRLH